jgi:hypothetical protein
VPVAALVLAAACGRETPTEVGGGLLPGDAVRSFEVMLDATRYLVLDTAISGFDDIFGASFQMVAQDYQGALDAHTLGRFEIPRVISAPDSGGATRADSTPHFTGGRIVLQLDTLRSNGPPPVLYRVFRIEEEWDPTTVSWTHRVDSTGARLTWNQPGGLGGALVDTASWVAGVDSVSIRVDSQTIAAWSDTSTLARGALITAVTAGVRVRASDLVLRLDARPTFRPDTVVTVTVRPPDPTFIFDPVLGARRAEPLVGGRPSWRTYLQFQEGLDTLTVPCPQGDANCRVNLRDATVTYGALVFQPVTAPLGYLPQDSMRLGARTLLVSNLTPLERSPLGEGIGVSDDFLLPSRFLPPGSAVPVEVPITTFVRNLVADTLSDGTPAARWMAVVPVVEGIDFGVASFEAAPRLRLVITVANQLQLR